MPTLNGATDVNGASARLSGLLSSEPLPTENQEPEAQEEQAQEQEATPEQEELNPETQEGAEPESDTEEDVPTYKVKVDGEELEVTLDELQKGYMMEANYRNKTTALSKERETIEQKAAEVDKQLEDARLILEDEVNALDSPEMQRLKDEDPDEYIKIQDRVNSKVKKFEALKEKRAEEHKERQSKLIQKEKAALLDAFPAWSDQTVMQKEAAELMEVMKSYGYSETELNSVSDHRMFVLADKAKQLDAITKANLEAKKVKPKPKSVKPGNGTTKQDIQSDERKKMRDKLKKSGNLRDAVSLLKF